MNSNDLHRIEAKLDLILDVLNGRTNPAPTKPSIDWSHIAPRFKWLARDNDGEAYFFEKEPTAGRWRWCVLGGYGIAHTLASYHPGTCDWRDSLIQRPEGV